MAGEVALLEFRVLGELEVVHLGTPVALGNPQQQVVLLALLLEHGRTVTTDRIIDQLWGDQPPPGALSTIHSYVSRLRKVLSAEGRSLATTPAGYRLRVERAQVDALRFEDLAVQGRRALAQGDLVRADEALTRALSLWRGPCLPEFAHHAVAQAAIRRLDGLRLLAIEDAMDAALALGRHAASIERLERLVEQNPFRERMWTQLVLSLYRAGRQVDALERLRRIRRLLADQLGVDPGPALRRLEAQVLEQDTRLDLPVEATASLLIGVGSQAIEAPPAPPAAGHTPAPYVGRTRELSVLGELLAAAASGHGSAAIISGEPGIGKTALLLQAAALARHRGVTVLWARCSDSPGAPALWPWLQILRSVRDRLGIPPGGGAEPLSSLLAEDVAATTSSGTAPGRFALGRAVVSLFAQISAERPVLLVVDDAHWADPPSLEILHSIATELPGQRVLLAVAHRTGPESEHLARTLAALARQAAATTLELGGLGRDEISQLLQNSGIAAPGVAGLLHDRTDGNPFFVSELIQAARTGVPLSESLAIGAPVPPGVRDVLRARLLDLPPRTLELLTVAGVLGRECQLVVLAEVARLDPAECLTAIDPAIAARIIATTGTGIATLRFTHALVGETVVAELSPVRAARLHARCAQALLNRHGSTSDAAEPIAHHVLASSGLLPADRAVPAVTRAADVALARGAYEAGDRWLAAAAGLIAELPMAGERDTVELGIVVRRVRLRLLIRGYGVSDLPALVSRVRELSSRAVHLETELSEAFAAAAITAVTSGDRALANALTRQGLELAGASTDLSVRHGAHQAAARVAFNTGRITEAGAELAVCIELVRQMDPTTGSTPRADTSTPPYFTFGLAAFTAWIAGHPLAADAYAEECLARAEELDDPAARQLAGYLAAWVAAWDGDHGRSLRLTRRSQRDAPESQSPYFRHAAGVLASWSTAHLGDPEAALLDIDQALAAMLETKTLPWVSYAMALRAEILLLTGDLEAARGAITDAVSRVVPPPDHEPYIAEILRIQGAILAADPASVDTARTTLQEGIRLAHTQGAHGFAQRLQTALDGLR